MEEKNKITPEKLDVNFHNKKIYLRYYQLEALESVQRALLNGKNEMFIRMALGTGKMTLGIAIAELFLEKRKAKKILFLTSHKIKEQQLLQVLRESLPQTKSCIFSNEKDRADSEILISTYQKIEKYSLKNDEFTLIIYVDIIPVAAFKKITSISSAYHIGFLNSELENHSSLSDEYSFFRERLIYQYSLQDAFKDGYLFNQEVNQKESLETSRFKEIKKEIEYIKSSLLINTNDDSSFKQLITSLETVVNAIDEHHELTHEIIKNKLSKEDITSLGNKKKQLIEFDELLNNDNYFNQMKTENNNSSEKIWQNFFEDNTWIFGYGLNYIFNSPLDNKKLEQVISGHHFNQSGKRIDGLLKTRGVINSLCFIEIKTSKSVLLDRRYRNESWAISNELSGAIAQIQRYKYRALKDIANRIEIKSKDGEPTGEVIFNYSPRLILVIGNLSEFISENGINEDKLSSFEMFRKGIEGIDIITFDEIYERAKFIVES